ncbi:cysteine dioxygenase [Candidatus Protofrankia californiensis]|uniref:cysteine dioxygenase n=1 Tax=Candidatus Protofrankia californiensis TaxID=1839754 RepID=UPI001F49FB32|nr:cysteine dioxygenase family protein [Candidatus Protofrankia californiensis]
MPLIHPRLAGTTLVPDFLLQDENETVAPHILDELTRSLSAAAEIWTAIVRHDPVNRWYTRLVLSGSVEVWMISWCPGQYTRTHDHGGALGALTVAQGRVREIICNQDWRPRGSRHHEQGTSVTFGRSHIHKVGNAGTEPATTIHAYSPPEVPMRYAPDTVDQAVDDFMIENLIDGDLVGTVAAGGNLIGDGTVGGGGAGAVAVGGGRL